ncbi:MAG: BatD family protein [Gammaproteobacteria bacterium]|nr:BatD family protein [Gammaproteobacteria bacterium]MDP2139212.1 BatD family protein [Gammaproteobacteria bacterium]MDP2349019.1 BatD family protein [Gammaproteobacteria bacterium]
MVNLLACLLAAALTLFSTLGHAQPVTASVDRTELVRGETVTLTLRVDGQQGGVQMDLTPLDTNFQVVATRTSSQMRSINNQMESWIDYNLTLFPLHEGELEIPALVIAGATTQALRINVLPKTETSIAGQDLFMEAVVNKESVYVQEQLLFSIRLYYTINGIRNPIFTELEMPDSVIQMIGTPNQYEKLVEGVRYGVYEKQYAIFPQRSGTLEIPDIMFRGEVTDGSSNYVFRNLNTRTITAFSEGYEVIVREKPASFPADATWLPASEITIRESWNNDFTNVRVGDALTRVISVEAFGLDGAALPPLQLQGIDTVNVYPEPGVIERSYIDGNIVGRRVESSSLLMTATGTVRIPGVTIPWFDIDTEEVKYAVLNDTAVRVGAARSVAPDGTAIVTGDTIEDVRLEAASQGELEESNLVNNPTTPLWVIALAAALTALLFAFVTFNNRRRNSKVSAKKDTPVSAPMYRQEIAPAAEAVAFKELVRACEQSHLPALRLALIGWGRQYFADADLHNLDELAQRTANPEIRALCLRVQQALYGQDTGQTATLKSDIQRLLTLITELRTQRNRELTKAAKDLDYTLPPLYRA